MAAVALLAVALASVVVAGPLGSTIPFLVLMAALVAAAALRYLRSSSPDAPLQAFVAIIVGISLMLAIGLDLYRVEQDIDRQNSIFKFYIQIWVLLALASAYLLWRIAYMARRGGGSRGRKLWVGALAVLLLGASAYPLLGTPARLKDRCEVLPLTLDGMAYMREATYHDPRFVEGRDNVLDLSADYEGITWLQQNVEGSPIVLEGLTPIYRWGGRISVYTGLPSVVGWQWHQTQQRWNYHWAIDDRARDVDAIYRTTDAPEALALLRKYDVEYIYVGELERLYYPEDGIRKFDDALSGALDNVYENERVKVYRVRDEGPPAAVSPR